jgi:hypothetical protein
MRPLDEVLQDLADQDERLATNELISRIEQRLADPGDTPVVESDWRADEDADESSGSPRRRRRIPAAVAAGAALLVLIAVGLPILLLSGGESIGERAVERLAETTTLDAADTNATTSAAVPPEIWTGPDKPITLTLGPASVPAEEGAVTITISGEAEGEFWLAVCPGARGIADPSDWTGWNGWPDDSVAEYCGPGAIPQNPTLDERGRFTATLQVLIDAQAIEDGGVTIATGDIWTGLRGNAVLRIENDIPGVHELLHGGDLPAAFQWGQIPHEGTVLRDRSTFNGFMVPFCTDPTLMPSQDPWKLTATSPLIDLRDGPVAAGTEGGAFLLEVVYADDEAAVVAAFDTLIAELGDCLDTPDPTGMIVSEYVEDGWHWVADRYDLPPTGDESYAISYTAQNGDGELEWGGAPDGSDSDVHLAIVRSGDRIMLITEGSPLWLSDALTDSEFNEIVQTATNRLSP